MVISRLNFDGSRLTLAYMPPEPLVKNAPIDMAERGKLYRRDGHGKTVFEESVHMTRVDLNSTIIAYFHFGRPDLAKRLRFDVPGLASMN